MRNGNMELGDAVKKLEKVLDKRYAHIDEDKRW